MAMVHKQLLLHATGRRAVTQFLDDELVTATLAANRVVLMKSHPEFILEIRLPHLDLPSTSF